MDLAASSRGYPASHVIPWTQSGKADFLTFAYESNTFLWRPFSHRNGLCLSFVGAFLLFSGHILSASVTCRGRHFQILEQRYTSAPAISYLSQL